MTNLDTELSGEAVDAVRTLQAELSSEYSEMRSADVQLAEVILTAHAVTVSGRSRLQDIQRQLIEAINNPVAALDTPAGERHFLMFLRSKVAEIQQIVDVGALTDEDHAKLTRALGSGYLAAAPGRQESSAAAPAGTAQAEQGAAPASAIGSALGSLPQAAMGAAALPLQALGGLAGAASPLMGLTSGLTGGTDDLVTEDLITEDLVTEEPAPEDDEADDHAPGAEDDADDRVAAPPPPVRQEPPQRDPAQTRPAGGH